MYFSKLELRDSLGSGQLLSLVRGDGYRLHQALWRLFEGSAEENRFLYRQFSDGQWPRFYLLSAVAPVDSRGLWRIQSKDYEPQLYAGQRLAFSLRANPIVTRSETVDGKTRSQRHDVIMDARFTTPKGQRQALDNSQIIQDEGEKWLARRSEGRGFHLEAVQVDSYQQHRLRRRGGSEIRFSTVDFEGVLTVTDPEQLRQTLFQGLGPAKGFGCGLLLIRRV